MGDLIAGDDGLPAEEVGVWAKVKHERLLTYLDLSRGVRNQFLTKQSKAATFIDLFCGPGRARVKETKEWIDGSAVAARKISQASKTPFSAIYVADIDDEWRTATVKRLNRLQAPVRELKGSAIEAAAKVASIINCQSADKTAPVSACKFAPPLAGYPGSAYEGPAPGA